MTLWCAVRVPLLASTKVRFWHKLDPLLHGTFHGRQLRQFGTFLTLNGPFRLATGKGGGLNYPA